MNELFLELLVKLGIKKVPVWILHLQYLSEDMTENELKRDLHKTQAKDFILYHKSIKSMQDKVPECFPVESAKFLTDLRRENSARFFFRLSQIDGFIERELVSESSSRN